MNNEPVAWIDKITGKPKMIGYIFADYDIPLYLHPAKTLTDELKALLYSVNGDCYLGKEKEEALVAQVRKQYTEPAKTLTDEEIDKIASMCSVNEKDQINDREFARAILRKAQEK